jgi:glycosyltransferase involved in cell wall biosynthesis
MLIPSPLVTIGISNYNYSHFILDCLNSVIGQIYENIEIIIIDDHSTDNSIDVVEAWIEVHKENCRIKFIKNSENLGLTKNCNLILKNTKGKYFQPLDADDILMPQKIAKQVQLLEASNNTALVYSNVSVLNEDGIITNPDYCKRIGYDKLNMPEGRIFNELLDFNFISLPSVLINTRYAKEVGGFDETLRVQDYYMWLKLAEKYEIKYMPENTAYYRVHDFSMSNCIGTSLASADSVLQLKYRYYHSRNRKLKEKIAKNFQNGSVHLYQYKYPTTKKWLSVAFYLKPGFKTCIYFISVRLGIPYSFYNRIKKYLRT